MPIQRPAMTTATGGRTRHIAVAADQSCRASSFAVAAADNVMVTIPNQLGVDFNLKLLEAIAQIARTLGWHKG